MLNIRLRPAALKDLRQTTAYLSQNAGSGIASRYLAGVRSALDFLALSPEIGAPCNFGRSELAGLRRWRVKGFERWAIFYFATLGGVEVLRILHGARDLDEIFDIAKQT